MLNQIGGTTGCSIEDNKHRVKNRVKQTGFFEAYSLYEKEIVKNCDLCGHDGFTLYAHTDRYRLPVRSMQCDCCGLVFLSPKMVKKAYTEFYSKWYRRLIDAFNGRTESTDILNRSMDIGAEMARKFLSENMPNDLTIKTMLDVGGSTGAFAEKICNVTGAKGTVVDPNVNEIRVAAKKGLTTCCHSIEDWKTDKKYDLIAMLRTVEHLNQVKSTLERMRTMLTDGGVFLIDIVNHDWLIRHFKDRTLCTKIDHIYQITDSTIRKYFDLCKFEVIGNSSIDERYVYYLVKPC